MVNSFVWALEWFVLERMAQIVIPLILIYTLSPEITIVLSLVIFALTPLFVWSIKVNIGSRAVLKDVEYDRNSAIIDSITNYETVRIFGRKDDEQSYLSVLLEDTANAMETYQNSFRIIDFVSRVASILVFCAGAYIVYKQYDVGLISLGSVVVITSYLISLTGQLMNLVFNAREIFKNIPVMEDVYELMDKRPLLDEPEKPESLKNPKGEIEFKNVEFGYKKGQKAIKDVSFRISEGETIALVGPSGGGKTTLVRLLLRYFDVDGGSIEVDGVSLEKLGTVNANELVGVVPQEPILFNRSVKYNIGYAITANEEEIENHMEQIEEATKKSQIFSFIKSLPEGFETVVGERGIKLSGGQKQRIAIARALLKDPKIIIFDEATSMLDSESEKAIQKAFQELTKKSTTIIIAHRLSTIKDADRIFVIDEGRIIEEGNHEELLKNKALYYKLWKIQSGGFRKKK
jgi:ATP-binding cassette subfamily B protein